MSAQDIDNKDTVVDDKENASLPAPSLVKQGSILSSAPTTHPVKAFSRAPSQKNFAKTPSKAAPGTPKGGVLGSRTNFAARAVQVPQGLGKKSDASADTTPTLNPLTRTASAVQENAPMTTLQTSTSLEKAIEDLRPAPLESRRASLTKRGAAKDRISLLPDVPRLLNEQDDTGDNGPNKLASRQIKSNPVETATTLLSIERAVESEDKVVVGAADAKTKRRALENDEDRYEIEYCPPPVAEPRYDPGIDLDYSVLTNIPPVLAYQVKHLGDFGDLESPKLEPANIVRLPSSEAHFTLDTADLFGPAAETDRSKDGIVPTTRIVRDKIHGEYFDVSWDENEAVDEKAHPKNGRRFGILDLADKEKIQHPFEEFAFDVEGSESSLSADEDNILGSVSKSADKAHAANVHVVHKEIDDFHAAVGLDDLEDESKVQAPLLDFTL
ncbi:hypothetical protein EMPS_08279 [Entomortierella parvispora]|uniref:Uncharacterized protein n=1 Tax=Entomortierella parvispora TaxID=205924 RepID=A0A9P3HG28_9FUNG|nr:hypothetical protein EMPS_08279 [Entomortierella parvispora]